MVNAGVDPLYRLRRLGAGVGHALVKAESPPMPTPYEIAKAGGEGAKFLKGLPRRGGRQLGKSRGSLLALAELHDAKANNPASHVKDWTQRSNEYRTGLVEKWRAEAHNFRIQAEIIQGYMNEHEL